MQKLFKQTVTNIVKGKRQAASYTAFDKHLDKHGWPAAFAKDTALKTLQHLVDETLPAGGMREMTDLMSGIVRKPVKLTKPRRDRLKNMIELIKLAKVKVCHHSNLVLALFNSGGGFCPVTTQPEIICLDCGHNTTIKRLDCDLVREHLGIDITPDTMEKLKAWVSEAVDVPWIDVVMEDPLKAYNESKNKWEGDVPLKIADMKLFNSMAGK